MKRLSVVFAALTLAAAVPVLTQGAAQNPPAAAPAAPQQRPAPPQRGPHQWSIDSAPTAPQFSVKPRMLMSVNVESVSINRCQDQAALG